MVPLWAEREWQAFGGRLVDCNACILLLLPFITFVDVSADTTAGLDKAVDWLGFSNDVGVQTTGLQFFLSSIERATVISLTR